MSVYIFATKARIDNRKKIVKQQYLPHMSSLYGELQRSSAYCEDMWGRYFGPLEAEICWQVWGHLSKFQRVSPLSSVTAQHSSSGHQPNSAALNRVRHLYLAGRPSRWASTHIVVDAIETVLVRPLRRTLGSFVLTCNNACIVVVILCGSETVQVTPLRRTLASSL